MQLCSRWRVRWLPEFLKGLLNIHADVLSRYKDQEDWKLEAQYFKLAQRHFRVCCAIDRFASTTNTLLPRFNSAVHDLFSKGVDAFLQTNWAAEVNWVNLPFSCSHMWFSCCKTHVVRMVWWSGMMNSAYK